MKSPLTYYYDEAMQKRLPVNEEGSPIIDWGETIPGKKKEKILYVKNDSKDSLAFRQPFTTSEDLTIQNYPARLQGEDYGKVTLHYRPNPESIESHHSTWGFQVIIG